MGKGNIRENREGEGERGGRGRNGRERGREGRERALRKGRVSMRVGGGRRGDIKYKAVHTQRCHNEAVKTVLIRKVRKLYTTFRNFSE